MDYQRFIEQLPNLYENWDQDSVRPKLDRFGHVLNQVPGMTTTNVMQLLNFAVECMEPDEVYCEVGCYQGSTLIGALLDHPERMAYAIDNFSEFDPVGQNLEKLIDNLSKFGLQDQVYFCNQDFEEFFLELQEINPEDKIGVYLYDGAHDYRSQLIGLLLVKPFLAEKALIIVDDSNMGTVQQANWDFVAANPECNVLLELPTLGDGSPTFWNGIQILSWDRNRHSNYPASKFKQVRQSRVIQALYKLHFLEQDLNALYQSALSLHRQRQFTIAEKKYREYILWRNDDFDALVNLGFLYYETERYEAAIETLLDLIQQDDSKGEAYYIIGCCFDKKHQIEQAILAYKEAIARDSSLIDAYKNLGNLLAQRGEIEQAEVLYRQALTANPNSSVPSLTKNRADFQLREDAVVYLSSQAPYKYLPQYDYIFAEIARRVPKAQFMFLRAGVPQQRLQRAFAEVGLNSEDYCVFSPVLPRNDYLMLNLVSDIYLDTLQWSGGNTTLDAIVCNLPVVTCPGEFMRGRHSYGFLQRLGVTDTIAETASEYIEIAVKLGLEPEWRHEIVEKMKRRHDDLYEDKTCVVALENFYKQVVHQELSSK
jgi:tetratricopeptide (TPR) repeat protein